MIMRIKEVRTPAGFVTIETSLKDTTVMIDEIATEEGRTQNYVVVEKSVKCETVVAMEINEEALAEWKAAEASEMTVDRSAAEQIAALKAGLDATDDKIIKCSEYQLARLELPYDVAALHAERQAIRDQINTL